MNRKIGFGRFVSRLSKENLQSRANHGVMYDHDIDLKRKAKNV